MNNLDRSQRHSQTASEFSNWLKQNPFATHGEIFDAFNKIADANYRIERRRRRRRPPIGRI